MNTQEKIADLDTKLAPYSEKLTTLEGAERDSAIEEVDMLLDARLVLMKEDGWVNPLTKSLEEEQKEVIVQE